MTDRYLPLLYINKSLTFPFSFYFIFLFFLFPSTEIFPQIQADITKQIVMEQVVRSGKTKFQKAVREVLPAPPKTVLNTQTSFTWSVTILTGGKASGFVANPNLWNVQKEQKMNTTVVSWLSRQLKEVTLYIIFFFFLNCMRVTAWGCPVQQELRSPTAVGAAGQQVPSSLESPIWTSGCNVFIQNQLKLQFPGQLHLLEWSKARSALQHP